MKAVHLAALAVAVACTAGASTASGSDASPRGQDVSVPARFEHPRANPWFPLVPGTVSRYRGTDDGEPYRERVVVTPRTKVVRGITATVVRDVLRRADGSLAESTRDW
jgi:hypothetical protein